MQIGRTSPGVYFNEDLKAYCFDGDIKDDVVEILYMSGYHFVVNGIIKANLLTAGCSHVRLIAREIKCGQMIDFKLVKTTGDLTAKNIEMSYNKSQVIVSGSLSVDSIRSDNIIVSGAIAAEKIQGCTRLETTGSINASEIDAIYIQSDENVCCQSLEAQRALIKGELRANRVWVKEDLNVPKVHSDGDISCGVFQGSEAITKGNIEINTLNVSDNPTCIQGESIKVVHFQEEGTGCVTIKCQHYDGPCRQKDTRIPIPLANQSRLGQGVSGEIQRGSLVER